MIKNEDFKQSLTNLLAEAFGVSPSPHGFFLDSGQAGLLGMINQISAETASKALPLDQETIAAHCGHVLWLLNFFAAFERGEQPAADWAASWQTQTVDDATWANLRSELQRVYDYLIPRLQAREDWHPIAVSSWMMLLAHVSYHVGVIDKLRTAV